MLALCALSTAPPPLERKARSGRPLRPVLRSFPFVMMYLSWLLATTALFVPFMFLPQFAVSHGADLIAGSALISILGAASVVGRLGAGVLGKWMSGLTLFKTSVLVMGASNVIWLIMPQYQWLMLFAAILGVAYGLRIALMPTVLIGFFGISDLGAILGIFLTATGLASILGPMLAGFMVDISGSYQAAIIFAVAMGVLGFVAIASLGRNAAGIVDAD